MDTINSLAAQDNVGARLQVSIPQWIRLIAFRLLILQRHSLVSIPQWIRLIKAFFYLVSIIVPCFNSTMDTINWNIKMEVCNLH